MRTPEYLMTRGANASKRKLNWLRLLGIFLMLAAAATFITLFMIRSDKEDKEETKKEDTQTSWNPNISYRYDPPKPADPTAPTPEPEPLEEPAEEEEEEEEKPDPRIEILRKAANSPIQAFTSDLKRFEEFKQVAMAAGAGGSCEILPGDKGFLRVVDFISTDNGGTVVAELVESIPGQGCDIAMAAGAKFVGFVNQNVQFAQKTAGIDFKTITTNDGRVIASDNIGSSAMGSGGVPGDVDRHLLSKLGAVAVATSVDLAGIYLGSEGDGYRLSINNTGSILEDFVRPYINRRDTITRDPTKDSSLISVTFTQKISM